MCLTSASESLLLGTKLEQHVNHILLLSKRILGSLMPPKGLQKAWKEPADLLAAVELLAGNKKQADKAVDSICTILAGRDVARRMHEDERGCSWYITVLEKLFKLVLEERTAHRKKPTTAGETRMTKYAEAIRSIVGMSHTIYNNGAFRKVYEHLLQTSTVDGRPYPFLCQPYIKAIRNMLTFHPHVEHLNPRTWKALVNWCWCALLGEPLDTDERWDERADDTVIELDDYLGTEDVMPSTDNMSARALILPVTVELINIIALLVASPMAPLLPSKSRTDSPSQEAPSTAQTGSAILSRITTYLTLYPTEVNMHLPLIRSANLILAELELNSLSNTVKHGVELLPHLVTLWSTRKMNLREQVLIALRILMPHLGREAAWKDGPKAEETIDHLGRLLTAVENDESGPLALSPLNMSNLRLVHSGEQVFIRPPLQYPAIAAGSSFTHEMVMTWVTMELRADLTMFLNTIAEVKRDFELLPASRAAKRRKFEDPIQRLVSAVSTPGSAVQTDLIALQTLVIFVSRHWIKVGSAVRVEVRQTLIGLLGDSNPEFDSWAMICLSTIAAAEGHMGAREAPVISTDQNQKDWLRLWQHATRRFSNASTCRAAALAMDVLLSTQTLSSATCLGDVENLLADIDLQGPSFPYDSVCSFLTTAMHLASSDIRLYRKEFESKVLRWLSTNWNVLNGTTTGFNVKTRVEPHAPTDILSLVAKICRLETIWPLHPPSWEDVLPDSMLSNRLHEEYQTEPIRRFTLYAELGQHVNRASALVQRSEAHTDLSLPRGRTHQVILFFERCCRNLLEEWAATPVLQAATPEKVRRTVDLAIVVASFQALLLVNGVNAALHTTRLASELLDTILPCLSMTSFGMSGQALMWRAFKPLLQSASDTFMHPWPALVYPSEASGIRQDILPTHRYHQDEGVPALEDNRYRRLQIAIWSLEDFSASLRNLGDRCRASIAQAFDPDLQDEGSQSAAANLTTDLDDFAPAREAAFSKAATTSAPSGTRDAAAACTQIWVQMLTVGSTLINSEKSPTKDKRLLNVLVRAEAVDFKLLASAVFDAAGGGYLRIGADAIETFLDLFHELLGSYHFGRHQPTHTLALDFLEATMAAWLEPSIVESALGEQIGNFISYYSDNIASGKEPAWRTRLRFVMFLDRYFKLDPSLRLWPGEVEELDEQCLHPAVDTVIATGGDLDARVRFQAATSCAFLISLASSRIVGASPDAVFRQACHVFSTDHQDIEDFLSTILLKINVCIASADLRSNALYHLYEVYSVAHASRSTKNISLKHTYALQILHGLEAVAQRLGLSNLSRLYLSYSPTITSAQINNGQKPMRLPLQLYGFRSRKSFAQAVLPTIGGIALYLDDPETFLELSTAAEVEPVSAVQYFVSATVAVAYGVTYNTNDKAVWGRRLWSNTQEALSTIFKGFKIEGNAMDLAKSDSEFVIIHLLLMLDESEDIAACADALNTRQEPEGQRKADLFSRLMVHERDAGPLSKTIDPSAACSVILYVIDFMERNLGASYSPTKLLYNGFIIIAGKIAQTPLVAEQRRGIRSLGLLLAANDERVSWSLLATPICRCLATLYGFDDIAPSVLVFLQRVLGLTLSLSDPISGLADLVVYLASQAKVYSTAYSASTRIVGEGTLRWLSEILGVHKDSAVHGEGIRHAIMLLEGDVHEHDSRSFTDVSTLMRSSRLKSDKTRLAKPLLVASDQSSHNKRLFSTSLFWHLKAGLRSRREDDAARNMAFLDLLHDTGGQIDAPDQHTIKLLASAGTSTTSLAGSASRRQADPEMLIKATIVALVYDESCSPDSTLADKAQRTLAALLGAFPEVLRSTTFVDSVKTELSQLRQSSLLQSSTPPRTLTELCQPSWLEKAESFDLWVQALATLCVDSLRADDAGFDALKDILGASSQTASKLLPHLIHCLLILSNRKVGASESVPRQSLSAHFNSVLAAPVSDLGSLKAIIEVVQHLRHFVPLGASEPNAHDTWLEVDFSALSRCAVRCGRYATALLFLEIAEAPQSREKSKEHPQSSNDLLYEVYSNVEDPDGFYGVHSSDIRKSLLLRYHHEGEWSRAFEHHGAAFQTSSPSADTTRNVLASLEAFGFHRIASHIMTGMREASNSNSSQVDPLEYEVAWRNGNWDLPLSMPNHDLGSEALLYSALRAVHRERETGRALETVRSLIGIEMRRLGALGMESVTHVRDVVKNLLSMREIVECLQAYETLEKQPLSLPDTCDFATAEQAIAVRISVIRSVRAAGLRASLGTLGQASSLLDEEKACHLQISCRARREGRVQAAVNAITAVQAIEDLQYGPPSMTAQDEFSQVLWAQGEYSLAIQQVTDLCRPASRKEADSAKAKAEAGEQAKVLARLADWTFSAKLEPPDVIRSYFSRAYDLVEHNKGDSEQQAGICHSFARFLDKQHDALAKSSELQRLRTYRDRKKSQLSSIQKQVKSLSRKQSAELQSVQDITAREFQADSEAVQELEKSKKTFLHQSLKMYSKALILADTFNDSVIRLVTMWLEHHADESIHDFMGSVFEDKIPSWKFVFLGPQLAARLNLLPPGVTSSFQDILNRLMLRLSQEHPYQILYQVITLAYGHSAVPRKPNDASSSGRGAAAAAILAHIANSPGKSKRVPVKRVSADMQMFSTAAVKWCAVKVAEDTKYQRGGEMDLPSTCPLLSLKRLPIPVATSVVKVDPSSRYENVATLVRYSPKFKVAGGLSRPTILSCTDSDGRKHLQLFKRGDDVRKDAVMEQVFQTVNDLLDRDKRARDRHLHFRTYVVIPLAENNGLIEFVGDTQSIGDWLLPAHKKYGRNDMPAEEFRKGIKELQDKDHCSPLIPKRWREQMKRFHPVMRHFFVERHKEPMAWLAMRLCYARSVAVTSIVGYMVGLGDRHCSNILIDKRSGELVHIDLGIAFDEGRDLRIPERVPFRLTNDLVDALGISGVDGTFRRCSEETLRVLRESSSLIMTVLEVFKHDPLQAWGATREKIARLQAERGGLAEPILADPTVATTEKADRILARVASKLQTDLSVEYTVNQLIQEARDPERLSTIFVGWQSWL